MKLEITLWKWKAIALDSEMLYNQTKQNTTLYYKIRAEYCIAVDDFGKGYTSIERNTPIHLFIENDWDNGFFNARYFQSKY